MKTIDICILLGRGDEHLRTYIDSFNRMRMKPKTLIVVVDMNFRNSVPNIEIEGDVGIELIQYNGKKKQPEMRNLAVLKSKSDYIWFMDDDVSLPEQSFKQLQNVIDDIDDYEIGCIAGKIIEDRDYDPSKLIHPIELNAIRGTIGYFEADVTKFPQSKYKFITSKTECKYPCVDFPQGTSMVFNRQHLLKVGGFNEILGIDYASYEDSEPSFALWKNNFITVYVPNFEIIHHKLLRVDGTSRNNPTLNYQYALIRNHCISLVGNQFPSRSRSVIYSIFFSATQTYRFLAKHKEDKYKCAKGTFISALAMISGIIIGLKLSFYSRKSYYAAPALKKQATS